MDLERLLPLGVSFLATFYLVKRETILQYSKVRDLEIDLLKSLGEIKERLARIENNRERK